MSGTHTSDWTNRLTEGDVDGRLVGFGGLGLLVALTLVALAAGVNAKLVAISWTAFGAMVVGAPLGARAANSEHVFEPVWGYGLASGAMVTSAALFLVPQALGQHGRFGSLGIAVGFLAGYVGHTLGHRLTHLDLPVDRTAAELTVHALSAGAIIGVIYTAMPSLTSILGVALVAHKAPAGYAAARRLASERRSPVALLLPAAAVGLVALPVGIVGISLPSGVRGLVFGVAAGVFLHVAMDFLPSCETGGEVHAEAVATSGESHELLDRLRLHAVASTVVGGFVVFVAWLAV